MDLYTCPACPSKACGLCAGSLGEPWSLAMAHGISLSLSRPLGSATSILSHCIASQLVYGIVSDRLYTSDLNRTPEDRLGSAPAISIPPFLPPALPTYLQQTSASSLASATTERRLRSLGRMMLLSRRLQLLDHLPCPLISPIPMHWNPLPHGLHLRQCFLAVLREPSTTTSPNRRPLQRPPRSVPELGVRWQATPRTWAMIPIPITADPLLPVRPP